MLGVSYTTNCNDRKGATSMKTIGTYEFMKKAKKDGLRMDCGTVRGRE